MVRYRTTPRSSRGPASSHFFDLVELQFDWCLASEDRDERAHLFFFRLNLVHDSREIEERTGGDFDAIAFLEVDLELGRLDAHLLEDRFHFFVLQRYGLFTRARTADES